MQHSRFSCLRLALTMQCLLDKPCTARKWRPRMGRTSLTGKGCTETFRSGRFRRRRTLLGMDGRRRQGNTFQVSKEHTLAQMLSPRAFLAVGRSRR